MYRLKILNGRDKRKLRVRKKITGTVERPRLSVFRSVKYTYAQLIDDKAGKTLVDTSSSVKEMHKSTNKVTAAKEVGKLLAKLAIEKNIKKVVFDRNGYRYQGRVKSVAEGAREGGLEL